MKKFFVIALSLLAILTSAVAPKQAKAVEPGTVLSGALIVTAAGAAIWTIYEIAVVGDELSASTSEFSGQVMNKRQFDEKLQDDAFAYIGGNGAPTALLSRVIEEVRNELGGAAVLDEEIAKAIALKIDEDSL